MKEKSERINKIIKLIFWLIVVIVFSIPILQEFFRKPEIIEDHRDLSWLTGEPCSPPCWYGLIPGVSTFEDVLETVDQLSFVRVETKKEFLGRGSDYIAFDLYEHESGVGGLNFQFSEGILSRINQSINFDITLAEVVSTLGEPDFIIAIDHPQIRGEWYCDVDLIWVSKKMALGFRILGEEISLQECEAIANGKKIDSSQSVSGFIILDLTPEKDEYSYPWPGLSLE